MEKVRMGIIGTGGIGMAHCRRILSGEVPEMELAAVACHSKARAEWARGQLPAETQIFMDSGELMASGRCDAVLIATPHRLHAEQTIAAFRHRLHVLCEKPAGVSVQEARAMNAEADRHPGLAYGMMFNQRTNSLYVKMREMVQSGGLGQLKRVNWIITDWYRTQDYYDAVKWRGTWAGDGGGVLLNQSPHQLDLLQWICGMPDRVTAFCHEGKWHDTEVEDDVTAYMEFPDGATGVFVTSTGDAPGTNRLEISGSMGRLVCEDGRIVFDRLAVDERSWRGYGEGFEKPPCEREEVRTSSENTQHAGVMNAFAAHILRGAPMTADGREGLQSLMLSNAMYLSSWLGRQVELPFDEMLFQQELDKRRAVSRKKPEA